MSRDAEDENEWAEERGPFIPHAVEGPVHVRKQPAREPGDPVTAPPGGLAGTRQEAFGLKLAMNGHGKSDGAGVPVKSPNKAGAMAAEVTEGRAPAKRNLDQGRTERTQGREGNVSPELERVREAARRDKTMRFTSLLHHVYEAESLRWAYDRLRKDAAAGVDGETWRHYGENLEENIQDLSGRLKRGGYRAKPVKRAYIPKADGKERPLGIAALEDKIVQGAVVRVLNAIYETDFLGFSYGFRPGRKPHDALDALYKAILTRRVDWILDADIRGFFDGLSHEWLVKFVEHRVGDKRVIRLIQKWLKAGVMEEGRWRSTEEGTPQGASASPLLANIFLHYVLDVWVHHWRRTRARGDVVIVRWADDFVVGFQHRWEAEAFWKELKERFLKFRLELHPEKTQLLEFGRYAAKNRGVRGEGRPGTFNFMGFTHMCGKTRGGAFTVLRQTMKKKLRVKLQEVKQELQRRMHEGIPKTGEWLKAVVGGHNRYYGVPTNLRSLRTFREEIAGYWKRALGKRSQKGFVPWRRMYRITERWLPQPQLCHSFPLAHMPVIT